MSPRATGARDRLRRALHAAAGWGLVVAVALTVFVASDPHLYPDPPLHITHLIEFRARTMVQQEAESRWHAGDDPLERAARVLGEACSSRCSSARVEFRSKRRWRRLA